MTYRQAVYAVIEAHKKQFATSDIRPSFVLFWIQVVANRLITKSIDESESTNGYFLTRFCDIPVLTDAKGEKYSDLPSEILNLNHNSGIDTVTYSVKSEKCKGPNFTKMPFSRTTVSEAWSIMDNGFETPSSTNPYIYTVITEGGQDHGKTVKVYYLGLECVDVDAVDMFLVCGVNMTDVCDLNENIPIDSEDEPILMEGVLRLIRFISVFPEDRKIDGEDTAGDSPNYIPTQANIADNQAQDDNN